MKIKKIGKYILESLLNLKRNLMSSFISVGSISVLLLLVGLFSSILVNTSKLTSDIESKVTINVYLDTTTNDNDKEIKDDQGNIVKNNDYQKIKNEISKIDGIKSITWSSKEEQLANLVKTMGKTWETLNGASNPLYDVYIVKVKDQKNVKSISKKISKISNVSSAKYGGATTDKIIKIAAATKTWGTIGIIILISFAIFLISNTIKITIINRANEIKIKRLVGAKNSHIKLPFLFEGIEIGLFGAIFPSIILGYLYNIFYTAYNSAMITQNMTFIPPSSLVPKTIILMFLLSMIIGSASSILSMNKYLKI